MMERGEGFTLIEVLVVLVITAMVAGMLLQGFSQVLDLRIRYLSLSQKQSTAFLQQHWFTTLCNGIVPDFSNGENQFEGDRKEFSGLTLSPLMGYAGTPSDFAMLLEREGRETVLKYQDDSLPEPMTLMSFGERDVRFEYMTEDQKLHDFWPPMGRTGNSVPHSIMIFERDREGERFMAARVDSRHENWDERLPRRLGIGF